MKIHLGWYVIVVYVKADRTGRDFPHYMCFCLEKKPGALRENAVCVSCPPVTRLGIEVKDETNKNASFE